MNDLKINIEDQEKKNLDISQRYYEYDRQNKELEI